MYNYLENMVEDVKEYIKNEIDFSEYEDMDELRESLNDERMITTTSVVPSQKVEVIHLIVQSLKNMLTKIKILLMK